MSRIRYLKPSFFTDEDVAELSFGARLLFQGLWLLADRDGRLEDRPTRIKVHVFPYDSIISIDELLAELAKPRAHSSGGFICRYVVAGQKYIQIKSFAAHQRPHPKEPPSCIPPCPPESFTAGREKKRRAAKSHGETLSSRALKEQEGNGDRDGDGDLVVDHPRARPDAGEPDPFDRTELVREAYGYIRTIAESRSEDPSETVRRCSTIPGSGYYLLPRQLDTAKPEHLERTVGRLRDEARAIQASAVTLETEAVVERRDELAAEFCHWYANEVPPEEHRGTALMRWLELKGIPYHLSLSRAIDDRFRKATA